MSKPASSLRGDNETRPELENLIQDAENYFLNYSTIVNDKQATCNLAPSNHNGMLEIMHDRTVYGNNESMLVECVKSKLVTGLKISEKHIRHFCLSDHNVCDVRDWSKATRHRVNKVHKFTETNLEHMCRWTLLSL